MIFRINGAILFERFGAQTLIFDLKKNLPYVLNGMAAHILRNTDGKKSLTALAEEVSQEFDVEYPRAIEDIKGVYDEFCRKELIIRVA